MKTNSKLLERYTDENSSLDLEEICKLYMEGKEVQWNKLFQKNKYKKVSLPTYKFEKRRCWLNIEEQNVSVIEELMTKLRDVVSKTQDDEVSYYNYLDILIDYSGVLLLKEFEKNNISIVNGNKLSILGLRESFSVKEKYIRLFNSVLDILENQELIEYVGKEEICFTKKAENYKEKFDELDEIKNKILADYPEVIYHMTLLDICVKNLNEIMNGKMLSTDIIFGSENGNLVENIYKNNSYMDYYHKLLSYAVSEQVELIKKNDASGRTIKILEIGSGTGGASKGVLNSISKFTNIKYAYTDISKALVEYGKEHYKSMYDFVEFRSLNIEKPLIKQGFQLGDYDIILAFDVLHATKDINFTIRQAKKLLRKYGTMFILEPTKVQDFSTLTFGTLDGWWLYKDEELRLKNSPLLGIDTWKQVLESNGFNNVNCIEKENGFEGFIIAESDGIYENEIAVGSSDKNEKKSIININDKINNVDKVIFEAWADSLGTTEIGMDESFFELGGDSIIAMKVVNSINQSLNIQLKIHELLNYDNIAALSQYVRENYIVEDKEAKVEKAVPTMSLKLYEEYCIEKTKKYTSYIASSEQKRIYFTTIIQGKDSISYNLPRAFLIEGKLDIEKAKEAFNLIVERHESLRTNFEYEDNQCIQKIHKKVNFKVKHSKKYTDNYSDLLDEFVRPFDLEKDVLMRVEIVETADDKYLLMVDMHHIISDGMSINIIIDEFRKIYYNEPLDSVDYDYKDYTVWQKEYAKTDQFKKQEEFWVNEFKDSIPVLNMPTDYQRQEVAENKGELQKVELDEEVYDKLSKYVAQKGTTIYNVCLSALYILLYKYSNQEDIVIGTVLAGRQHFNFENVIGMFVNSLPIRSQISGDMPYNKFLDNIKDKVINVFSNQDYKLEDIMNKLDIKRNSMSNPLFNVMFVLQNMGEFVLDLEDMKISSYDYNYKSSKFDITLMAFEKQQGIELIFEYSTMLFEKETIIAMSNHYVEILKNILKDDKQTIGNIKMLTDKEVHKITKEFNNSYVEYDKTKNVVNLFNEVVEEYGNKTAIVFNENKYTYAELDKKTNIMANNLKKLGMGHGSVAAIVMDRCDSLIISMIAVMKTGACYMPVDPEYPIERIEYMLEDSNADFVIAQNKYKDIVEFNGQVVIGDNEEILKGDSQPLNEDIAPSSLLYIIYTSGTTGKPKGVMLEHSGIVNYKNHCIRDFKITYNKKVLAFASPSFDAFESEMYMSILRGAELHLTAKENLMDPKTLNEYIIKNDINVITVPPFLAERLDIDNSKLDVVICAGSESRKSIAEKIGSKINYFNAYGPTEDTICTTVCLYNADNYRSFNTVPIGYPIPNHRVYILDKDLNLVPIGCPGELCVSSDSLARGYINRDDLTKEKFIENPYEPGVRMYRTGDLAKWSEEGVIEYLGRIDRQVKIRGFRIELNEIEESLTKFEFIKSAAVIAGKDKKYIVGYYTSDIKISPKDIRIELKKTLPNYMIPAYLIQVDDIPLTINGKVDIKKLPPINLEKTSKSKEEKNLNKKEKLLLSICREVLENDSISAQDDLFDFGLDSVKAIQILSEIRKENYEISITNFFKYSKIDELYKYMNLSDENKENDEEGSNEDNELIDLSKFTIDITSTNRKMHELINKEEIIYSFDMLPVQYQYCDRREVSGSIVDVNLDVDDETVIKSVKQVIEKHDILRGTIKKTDNKNEWNIHKYWDNIKVPLIDLTSIEKKSKYSIKDKLINYVFHDQSKDQGNSLYSICIIKEEKNKYSIVLAIQHIIYDGVSNEVFKNDILDYCKNSNNTIIENSLQYRDYASQINKGIIGVSKENVIERYKLNEFISLKDKMEFKALENNIGIYKIIIPMEDKNTDVVNKILEVVYKFSRDYFKIESVPVLMVVRGREYEEKKYYDLIGNCIDVIPVILEDKNKAKNLTEDLTFSARHNINFMTLLNNYSIENNQQNILSNSNIIVNIQGVKLDIFKRFDEKAYKDVQISKENVLFMARYDMNEIELTCTIPYLSDDEKIKEIIERNFS